jgi:hypothetical protein
MRGTDRLAFQRLHDHALDFGVVNRARDAGSRLVEQPVEAVLDKAPAPFAHGLRGDPLACRYRLVAQTRCAAKYDPRPQRQRLRRLATLCIAFQNAGDFDRQFDLRYRPTRPHPLSPAPLLSQIYYMNFWLRTLGRVVN